MLAASGGIWLNRLTAALGLYDPNFIIPLLQSCYIAFATISGGVFFQVSSDLAGLQNKGGAFRFVDQRVLIAARATVRWLSTSS